MADYKMGLDIGSGRDIGIEECYMRPTAEYPQGSWLYKVGDIVQVATGYFALEYPDKPSPYWHGSAPYFVVDIGEWPWQKWSQSAKLRED